MALITTDLHHQFDASNASNLSVISDEVDTWTDEISSYVASAPDAGSRPAYSSAVQINGINVVYFNGVDSQSLSLSEFGTAGSGVISPSTYPHQYFFSVLKVPHYASTGIDYRAYDNGISATTSSGGRQALTVLPNGLMRIDSPAGDSTTFSYPDNEPFILCAKLDETGSGVTLEGTVIRVNGETLVDDSSGNMVNYDGVTFASRAGENDSVPEMAFAEHLYYRKSTPLTLSEIEEIETYLNDKWAVFSSLASGSVTFNASAFSDGTADFFSAPSPTGTLTLVDSDVAITSGVATMTTARDSTKDYIAIARGLSEDFTGTLESAPTGDVITIPTAQDLTGISIGGVNDDHYIFRATGGTGSGTEVTVISRSGQDITVNDASAFDATTSFTLGRFLRGISKVLPKD